jgi:hypothetical protein
MLLQKNRVESTGRECLIFPCVSITCIKSEGFDLSLAGKQSTPKMIVQATITKFSLICK